MKPRNGISSGLAWVFRLHHYYGDTVRQLFLIAALALFLLAPLLPSGKPAATITIAIVALVLALFAGLTNPRRQWVAVVDIGIAVLGCLFFEMLAIQTYAATGAALFPFFLVFQALAIDFLFAFYFSVKTVRAMRIADENSVE